MTTKGFGSKCLAKLGYKPGQGLGRESYGIVRPIDVKLRPQRWDLVTVDSMSIQNSEGRSAAEGKRIGRREEQVKQARVLSDAKDIQKKNQIGLVDHSQPTDPREDRTSRYKKVKEKELLMNQTEQDENTLRERYESSRDVVKRLEAVLESSKECEDIAANVLWSISPTVVAKESQAR
ncbi:hypothetical protein BJ742DRAFT_772844 [Cladochytrium replicatum]|nr:hypothetical protein BJ742DRAFT_772844 [Cladochytrium replicatum]